LLDLRLNGRVPGFRILAFFPPPPPMLKLHVPADSIRLIAIDIDGTLLNPEFRISATDLATLRRAHAEGVEVILVTGRRHTFALPIAQQLGFDLWLISSNGAVTRSLAGETFHRDLLPEGTCRELVRVMQEFRGQTVLTFDSMAEDGDGAGTIVIERLDELEASIPALAGEESAVYPVCGSDRECADDRPRAGHVSAARWHKCSGHCRCLGAADCRLPSCELSTRAAISRLSMCLMRNVPRGMPLERWANYRRITREQVMAVGDNYNDIEMLAFAGHPFIMGMPRGAAWPRLGADPLERG